MVTTDKPTTAYTAWDAEQRRYVKVPAGTPGAIEWVWCDWADQWITVPGRDD